MNKENLEKIFDNMEPIEAQCYTTAIEIKKIEKAKARKERLKKLRKKMLKKVKNI